ncbi:energy transducer TonB [Maricaulis parjimensis]|uniref:energy transducer TonB n=1 Tax=Maricaulis parjimensis TaxID=144023 RepID=UPI00193A1C86|nr:energy transducer TonB [Maricaulis parjimensis]
MRLTLILLLVVSGLLSSCGSVTGGLTPSLLERDRGPFVPRDELPVPPNVSRLIGEGDCQGSTLAAVSAGMPDYPHSAWVRGRQGWVVVRFNVLADGQVDDVRIAHAVPSGPFNRVSRRAVSQWQFQPLQSGTPLQNCVVLFEYRLGEVRLR